MKKLLILLISVAFTSFGFAQDSTAKKMNMHEKMHYTCSMDAGVHQDKPGKCPKCGMDLVQEKKQAMGYCAMCKQKVALKDGKCSKCGMSDSKHKAEYGCMKCHTKSKMAGKCPKCGATMEEMKEMHEMKGMPEKKEMEDKK